MGNVLCKRRETYELDVLMMLKDNLLVVAVSIDNRKSIELSMK